MATETAVHVPTPASAWLLPFDDVNRVNELVFQAKGILATLSTAATSNVELPGDAVAGACWAAESLLDQIEAIATQKRQAA